MASGGKKRTTMAKISREAKLRARRADKDARKRARKLKQEFPPVEQPQALGPLREAGALGPRERDGNGDGDGDRDGALPSLDAPLAPVGDG